MSAGTTGPVLSSLILYARPDKTMNGEVDPLQAAVARTAEAHRRLAFVK